MKYMRNLVVAALSISLFFTAHPSPVSSASTIVCVNKKTGAERTLPATQKKCRKNERRSIATTPPVSTPPASTGVYKVGQVGPGGGIVFYVSATPFASPGSDCAGACRYLEAAPTASEVKLPWASFESGNTSISLPATFASSIGSGMGNSIAIQAQPGNTAGNSAAVYALNYANGGKTDWHLPSKGELDELYVSRKIVGFTNNGHYHWSSTEDSTGGARSRYLAYGDDRSITKATPMNVRPIRAF